MEVDRSERRRKRSFFKTPMMSSSSARGAIGPGGFRMLGGPDPRLEALGVGEDGIASYYEGPGKEMVAREWEDGN